MPNRKKILSDDDLNDIYKLFEGESQKDIFTRRRIHDLVDRISDMMVDIAHLEEKASTMDAKNIILVRELEDAEQTLHDLKSRVKSNEATLANFTKAVWLLGSAFLTAAIAKYAGMF